LAAFGVAIGFSPLQIGLLLLLTTVSYGLSLSMDKGSH